MKGLTSKEEEIMNYFWHKGPLFVKELLDFYDEPKPHFNTLSTIVRGLEEKGYVSHKAYGKTYQYFSCCYFFCCLSFISCYICYFYFYCI